MFSIIYLITLIKGFSGGGSGKEPACQCRRHNRCRLDPSVRKIPWRRAWQTTPVFFPGESPWTLEGYSPWGQKEHMLVVSRQESWNGLPCPPLGR